MPGQWCEALEAQWSDVLEALILEAAAIGEGVAWEDDRARAWWDTGAVTAVAVKDGAQLIAYALPSARSAKANKEAEEFRRIRLWAESVTTIPATATQVNSTH